MKSSMAEVLSSRHFIAFLRASRNRMARETTLFLDAYSSVSFCMVGTISVLQLLGWYLDWGIGMRLAASVMWMIFSLIAHV